MAKKAESTTDITVARDAGEMPAHLAKQDGETRLGTAVASKYQTINRLTIVQSQAKKEKRDKFEIGTMALFPDEVEVCAPNEEVVVIPLLFYPTWEKWSDYNDNDSPTVMETEYDEHSDIARRSKTKDTRTERYGDPENNWKYSYIESLNCAVVIDSGPAKGEIAILSLNKSQHYVGRKLARMVARTDADIFGRRIALSITDETDGNNDWHGFRLNNPSEEMGGAWTTAEQYEQLKAMHLETQAAYDARMIVINRDDENENSGAGAGAGGYDEGDLPPV